MDILFDIIFLLHSLLWTRLPYPWTFFKLQLRTDLTIILNNITYFAVYSAFLAWLVKVFISRFKTTLGTRLEAKDKYFAVFAVISWVFAMHVLWPFLLFITHFITCSFYPWATTAVVLLLYFYPLTASLRMLCSNVSSKISNFKEYSKGIFSFEWLTTSVSVPATTEPTTIYPILHRPCTEKDYVRTNTTIAISPGISVEEEYRPSDAPVVQPRPSPEKPPGSSATPVIQPPTTIIKPYRPSDQPKLQPQIIPQKPHEPPETHTRQNHLDRETQTKTTTPEDFSQQVDRERRRIRTSPPGISLVTHSNPPGFSTLRRSRTTRQGTVYGPPDYFL
ncbi:hypothetical protein AVEN_159259-1 [Araneus ventricosus]|uniref:Uncharacterized protein n=1 Tax=Araneus ventricosus TaxID=182803 RepID=A0A4Y2A1D5_ARAVE|nr:hypothetical protein AVEN_159259-1 [Araneus ventricosus]